MTASNSQGGWDRRTSRGATGDSIKLSFNVLQSADSAVLLRHLAVFVEVDLSESAVKTLACDSRALSTLILDGGVLHVRRVVDLVTWQLLLLAEVLELDVEG